MTSPAYISLGAGESSRFNGIRKAELCDHFGVMFRDRLRNQFGNVIELTPETNPKTRCACDTFLQSQPFWGEVTVILLADVFYDDDAAAAIRENGDDLAFFTDKQDIFAIKFIESEGLRRLVPAAQDVLEYRTLPNGGRLWELYRRVAHLGRNSALPQAPWDYLCFLDGGTQDFDTLTEYQDWMNGLGKNRIEREKRAVQTIAGDHE